MEMKVVEVEKEEAEECVGGVVESGGNVGSVPDVTSRLRYKVSVRWVARPLLPLSNTC